MMGNNLKQDYIYDAGKSTGKDTKEDGSLDPWPQYNDEGFCHQNAVKGPDDTCDPYWLPLGNVISGDPDDRFLIPLDPPPE